MPRNDQITRQWHLLRRLEGSNGLTLSELVEAVPDDYPKNARTVRRDLEALEAVGFPLVTEHNNGQTRWRLIEEFRNIPAVGFSATELMALTFSRNRLNRSKKPKSRLRCRRKTTNMVGPWSRYSPIGIGPHKSYRQHRQTIDLISQGIVTSDVTMAW